METAPANRSIHRRSEQAQRHSGSTQRPNPLRSAGTPADGFLSHSFAPKYTPAAELPGRMQTEKDFFRSLSLLKKHYGINVPDFRSLPYPYNILMAKQQADKAVRINNRIREVAINALGDKSVCLTVRETFRQAYSLYYIPVIPVYRLWQKKRQQATAALLTAVCAYLYIEAGLSYYRDEDTYMYYNYEILKEWMVEAEDEDRQSYQAQSKNMDEAERAGDFIQSKMMDKGLEKSWGEMIAAFRPKTAYQQEALTVARSAWDLAQTYPSCHLSQHAGAIQEDDDEYDYNQTVCMHESIGFVGSTTDALSETLFSMTENDFNERMHAQEPELLTYFNEANPAYTDELAYEEGALQLIDDLTTLLLKQP